MSKIPKNQASPIRFLKGCYAYSYTAYWRAVPPYNIAIPQLGAFYESPSTPNQFNQIPGYSVGSFAGYVCFDGAGNLEGKGKANRGGVGISDIIYTGTYLVTENLPSGVFTGTFQTKASPTNFINHYFVAADNWKQLTYVILDTNLRQPVTSGCMIKI